MNGSIRREPGQRRSGKREGEATVVGTTLFKFDGNPYYSPSFSRGGLAGTFVVDVTHLEGNPTFKIAVEHRKENETSWSTAGTFPDITSATEEAKDIQGLQQIIRFRYEFGEGDQSTDGVHFIMQAPSWRPYP